MPLLCTLKKLLQVLFQRAKKFLLITFKKEQKMRADQSRNREKILKYFSENMLKTQKEAAHELGLSLMTISRHIREIKKELKNN